MIPHDYWRHTPSSVADKETTPLEVALHLLGGARNEQAWFTQNLEEAEGQKRGPQNG